MAIPATKDSSHYAKHTATGTGPLTWNHDKTPSGIADLCGNVWEWTGGIRTVKGELQILANNNAADSDHSQGATSAEWKAINASDGTLITPDGNGTTTGSVKMDWASSKLTYDTSISDASPGEHNCQFTAIAASANISSAAKDLLIALGMFPKTSTIIPSSNQTIYFNNAQAERSFFRGGYFYYTTSGFGSFYGYCDRTSAFEDIGFRSAFVNLPAAS